MRTKLMLQQATKAEAGNVITHAHAMGWSDALIEKHGNAAIKAALRQAGPITRAAAPVVDSLAAVLGVPVVADPKARARKAAAAAIAVSPADPKPARARGRKPRTPVTVPEMGIKFAVQVLRVDDASGDQALAIMDICARSASQGPRNGVEVVVELYLRDGTRTHTGKTNLKTWQGLLDGESVRIWLSLGNRAPVSYLVEAVDK